MGVRIVVDALEGFPYYGVKGAPVGVGKAGFAVFENYLKTRQF